MEESVCEFETEREGGREGGREEREREGGREGGRERGIKGERESQKEREGGRVRERKHPDLFVVSGIRRGSLEKFRGLASSSAYGLC